MPPRDDSAVQALAREIERYLAAHPGASNTVPGIRSCWLSGSSREPTPGEVHHALESLVARGVVLKHVLPNGEARFTSAQRPHAIPGTPARPSSAGASYPGVYVEEVPSAVRPISGVATSIAAFVGRAALGPAGESLTMKTFAEYERVFGPLHPGSPMSYAVRDFFANGGSQAVIVRVVARAGGQAADIDDADITGDRERKTGLHALETAQLFNLLCIPPKKLNEATSAPVYRAALDICMARRAMLIIDPDPAWGASRATAVQQAIDGLRGLSISGPAARNAVVYFPCIHQLDPRANNQPATFAPCGTVAGLIAHTDATRGVWKPPAGHDAVLKGAIALQADLNDAETARLNAIGINCLRSFPGDRRIVWGARTLRSADATPDDYKYIPVRRLALFIEESLYRGLQWVIFEPNAEPLWAAIRLNVGAFLHDLFRRGALQGRTPEEAYWVKCDASTMTQSDIDSGIVHILVGFATLKPAEFVVIRISQIAGQTKK